MNKTMADVVELLGEPDAVLPAGGGMRSLAWKCSRCQTLHTFDEPVRPPAPCSCGGIAFEKTSRPTH